jgi:predicted enzyme related to lactoylglutathione lyase
MVTRDEAWPSGTPCWADLGVDDIGKASAFYTALFGWEVQQGPPEAGGYAMCLKNGRAVAGIGPKQGPPETPPAWTTYLASADADSTARKIKSAGGQVIVEPMDVMDAGRMLIAVDTAGAAFGVWQARAHTGFGIANEPGSVVWDEHLSRDFEGSKAFYQAVFGYEYGDMSSEGFKYATLKVDGREVGGIGESDSSLPPGAPAYWNVYFAVDSTDDAAAQVTAAGGRVTRPPWDTPYGRMAAVMDNQGAAFMIGSEPSGTG